MAPTLIGWVVFASDLDGKEMRSIEQLSAIPLQAAVLAYGDKGWSEAAGSMSALTAEAAGLARNHVGIGAAFEMRVGGETAIALAKPLPAFADGERAILLLAYPKSQALGDARKLQVALALITLIGLILVAIATWKAARQITEPLARLDDAAGRLASGEHVQVNVRGTDELARLATSFNEMSGKIAEREQRITQLAFNDVLTGLPNRSMFQQALEHHFRAADAKGSLFALHCLDLDQFKVINDTLGHPAGDTLLIEAAHRVQQAAGGHFVARLGGDEFVVLQRVGDDDRTPSIVSRGRSSRPCHVRWSSTAMSAFPRRASGSRSLRRMAAKAKRCCAARISHLYRAKEAGRGTFAFFEESLNERAQQRRQLEADLRLAIERQEFELHYQPLFDLELNRICSFEALLRWNHPTRGLVPPDEFVPVAEDTGLIVPIGSWVVREACNRAARWPDHIRVAVNASAVQFHRGALHETILHALADSGLEPNRLEVEITELIFLEGGDTTLKLLHSLRSLGVRIALDDFGTGYSSLSYLQSFPFDKLKIDRSFIQNLLTRDGASAIVRAITELAHALNIETTAEGVEETAQLVELRSHGCSSVQGFLFAEPMTAADVDQLFRTERTSISERRLIRAAVEDALVDFGDAGAASQRQRHAHLCIDQFEDVSDASFAGAGKRISPGAA